jgi:WNK lysine deficient protein kinase
MADGTEVVEVGGPPENPERYQRLKKSLGKGAFKTVYEAFDTVDSKSVAWNQVDRGNLDGKKYEEFRNEVLQLSKLDHRHIIKLTDWWESKDNQHVVFITELMSSGDLKKFMKTRKVNMKTMRRWARQILEALHYLHTNFEHPIVHRDIKCDNIFINGNLGELKLGDLGLCTMMTQTHAASVLGTPEFMAPEMYGEMYNQKVDIYAFGMCILEIFTGQYPYEECSNPGQIFMKVAKSIPPKALVTVDIARAPARSLAGEREIGTETDRDRDRDRDGDRDRDSDSDRLESYRQARSS